MPEREFLIAQLPRLFNFPYRLHSVGWMPDHLYIHRNTRLDRLFVCVTLRTTGESRTIIDGRERRSHGAPYLSVIRPGTRMETIQAVRHDELFFSYSEPSSSSVLALGVESGRFRMTPAVETVLSALRRTLGALQRRGAADRLDQLAVRFITECCAAREPEFELDDRVAEAAADLALHCSDRINLTQVAARHGMSRRTFFRVWKRHFGSTPWQYLIDRRLAFARELLLSSDCDLTEIALRSGFSGSSALIECFRARFGCTPLEFRRRGGTAPGGGLAGPPPESEEA